MSRSSLLTRAGLRDRQPMLGALATVSDPLTAEVLGRSGFDWIGVDLQHGALGEEASFSVVQALYGSGTPALVRVRWNEPAAIMRALDFGAAGVIVPMIESADQAAEAVAACRYPPSGVRSWGPVRARYLTNPYTAAEANSRVVCAVMVETAAGLDALDAITHVDGVDAVFVGPSDLALSLGHPPSLDNPADEVVDAIVAVAAACAETGISAGIFTSSSSQAIDWIAKGFNLISVHSDRLLMEERARQLLREIRAGER